MVFAVDLHQFLHCTLSRLLVDLPAAVLVDLHVESTSRSTLLLFYLLSCSALHDLGIPHPKILGLSCLQATLAIRVDSVPMSYFW